MQENKRKDSLRINVTIHGQPVIEAQELKKTGIVRNNADLVRQGIIALYQRTVEERLKIMRLKALEKTGEDEDEKYSRSN